VTPKQIDSSRAADGFWSYFYEKTERIRPNHRFVTSYTTASSYVSEVFRKRLRCFLFVSIAPTNLPRGNK